MIVFLTEMTVIYASIQEVLMQGVLDLQIRHIGTRRKEREN
jgi:hypothetical protein